MDLTGDQVGELVQLLTEARRGIDEPQRSLQVGQRVRNNVFRGLLGHVKSTVSADECIIVYDGEEKETLEKCAQISAIERCLAADCNQWKTLGACCNVGHWNELNGPKEEAVLGFHLGVESLCKEDRAIGVVIASMIGDALGAPFEGFGSKKIAHFVGRPTRFVPGTHMGIREAGVRIGMYTDDSNTLLALASALVKGEGIVDAEAIAREYASFYFDHVPKRGMPESAQRVLAGVRNGQDVRTTSIRNFCFGSFANGACMRISPLALILPHDMQDIEGFVAECCISSHCHPEALDAAVVQVRAVQYLLRQSASAPPLDPKHFIEEMRSYAKTEAVQSRLGALIDVLREERSDKYSDAEVMERASIDYGFQLFAPDAIATALWFVARYAVHGPEEILIRTIALGGDCDTTGAMAGAMVGARWGTHWIPARWYGLLENGAFGRDWAVQTARVLGSASGPLARPKVENELFMRRPVHLMIDRAMKVIRKHAGLSPSASLSDAHGARILAKVGDVLWSDLWDTLVVNNSGDAMRYDIACSLTSFFTESFSSLCEELVASRASLSCQAWGSWYTRIRRYNDENELV